MFAILWAEISKCFEIGVEYLIVGHYTTGSFHVKSHTQMLDVII